MHRALLWIAMAGCGFPSPGSPRDADDNPRDTKDLDASGDGGFDPGTCPTNYTVTLPSFPGVKYRLISGNAVFQSQRTACGSAITHLVAIETLLELTELGVALVEVPAPTRGWFYIGAVQRRDALATDASWLWLIGGDVDPTFWGAFETTLQPNDDDGTEDDAENLAVIDALQVKLIDVNGTTGYGAVCECDGK